LGYWSTGWWQWGCHIFKAFQKRMVMKITLKKTINAAFVAFLVWGTMVPCAGAVEIPRVPWEKDPAWDLVLEKAREDQQPILLDFHAPWCGPCKMLDSFVYNEKDVIQELASVLTVKFNIDIEANKHLKESFDISLLPTLVWCDAQGREVDRVTGFLDADEFLEKIGEFRLAEGDFSLVRKELLVDPEDPGLLLRMAELEAKRGNLEEAELQYRRLMNMRFAQNSDEGFRECISRGMLQYAALQKEAGLDSEARNMGRMAARLDGSEVAVAAFQHSIGDGDGAMETYRQMVERDDMNVEALVGFATATLEQREHLLEGSRMAVRAAVLSDEDPEIVALLSEIYYRRGLYRKSIRWIGKAIAADPGNSYFSTQLERYESALRNDPYGMKSVPE
jgi:thiol-disulfide isomerase/thioredoxin